MTIYRFEVASIDYGRNVVKIIKRACDFRTVNVHMERNMTFE